MLPVVPPTASATLPPRSGAAAPQSPENSQRGLRQRLACWRNLQLLKRALRQAGDPNLVLDMPCGNGQLWPLLASHSNRVIIAADSSAERLAQAQALQPPAVVERVRLLQTSAFAIDLPPNAVECVFCTRLFRHLVTSKQRLAMLNELHRVTSDSIIITVRVNNNYQALKPAKIDQQSTISALQLPVLLAQAVIEAEFRQTGFSIISHHDFMPGFSTKRIYVLRKEYKK